MEERFVINNAEEFYNFCHCLADMGVIEEEEHDAMILFVSGLIKEIDEKSDRND